MRGYNDLPTDDISTGRQQGMPQSKIYTNEGEFAQFADDKCAAMDRESDELEGMIEECLETFKAKLQACQSPNLKRLIASETRLFKSKCNAIYAGYAQAMLFLHVALNRAETDEKMVGDARDGLRAVRERLESLAEQMSHYIDEGRRAQTQLIIMAADNGQ